MRAIEVFENWLSECDSEHTKKSYKRIGEQFFSMVFCKSINEINVSDVASLDSILFNKKYKKPLINSGVKNSTLIYNTTVLKLLFSEFETYKVFDIDYGRIYAALRLRGVKTDSESTHKMTVKNYEDLKSWILNSRFSGWRGEAYALLLELMWLTGIRVSAMFNLNWSQICSEFDEAGNEGWVIKAIDKGKKLTKKPISNDIYDRLYKHFYSTDNDKVFAKLSQVGFTNLMKEFSDEYGVKITPHSIRKGGATLVFKITKDIEVVKNYCDHNNINTTIGYIENEWDRTRHGTYLLENLDKNIDFVKNLSGEQIFNMLIDSDKDILMQICHRAKNNNLVAV